MNAPGYLVLILLSILFLVAGYIFLQVNLYQVRNWKKTKAVVIEHHEGFDEDSAVYSAVVEFKTKNGNCVAKTNFQSSFPKAIGKQIDILYNPEDPETYTPYSVFSLYAAPCIFLAVGVLPIGLMVYFFLTGD